MTPGRPALAQEVTLVQSRSPSRFGHTPNYPHGRIHILGTAKNRSRMYLIFVVGCELSPPQAGPASGGSRFRLRLLTALLVRRDQQTSHQGTADLACPPRLLGAHDRCYLILDVADARTSKSSLCLCVQTQYRFSSISLVEPGRSLDASTTSSNGEHFLSLDEHGKPSVRCAIAQVTHIRHRSGAEVAAQAKHCAIA